VQSFYDPAYGESDADAIERHLTAIAGISPQSMHGPFADLCAGGMDAEIRRVTRLRYDQAIVTARDLGINRIILHHGYIPGTSLTAGWLKRITEFWRDLLADLPPDMHIHLENHLEHDTRLIGEVIDRVGDPRLDICLDIGHAHCHGRIPAAEWPRRLGGRISYVHLHDNHGESDEHLALGDGTIDLPAVLEALEEHCPEAIWALEASDDDQIDRSVAWLLGAGYRHALPWAE